MEQSTQTATPAIKSPPIPEAKIGALAERPAAGAVEVAQSGSSTERLIGALIRAAQDPQTDVARMNEIYALYEKVASVEREKAFLDALAHAQANLEPVRKNRENTHTKSEYADYAAIMREVGPAMTPEGLSLTFRTDQSPIPNWVRVIATLAHRSGHKQEYPLDFPLDDKGSAGNTNKTAIQAISSSLQYCMRRLTKMIFALAEAEEDDDGNGGRPAAPQVARVTEGQLATLCAKLDELVPGDVAEDKRKEARRLVEGQLCHAFKIGKIQDLPAAAYADAVGMITRRQQNVATKRGAK